MRWARRRIWRSDPKTMFGFLQLNECSEASTIIHKGKWIADNVDTYNRSAVRAIPFRHSVSPTTPLDTVRRLPELLLLTPFDSSASKSACLAFTLPMSMLMTTNPRSRSSRGNEESPAFTRWRPSSRSLQSCHRCSVVGFDFKQGLWWGNFHIEPARLPFSLCRWGVRLRTAVVSGRGCRDISRARVVWR